MDADVLFDASTTKSEPLLFGSFTFHFGAVTRWFLMKSETWRAKTQRTLAKKKKVVALRDNKAARRGRSASVADVCLSVCRYNVNKFCVDARRVVSCQADLLGCRVEKVKNVQRCVTLVLSRNEPAVAGRVSDWLVTWLIQWTSLVRCLRFNSNRWIVFGRWHVTWHVRWTLNSM